MELTNNQKQAIGKLDKEMEQAKDPCSKYIAEQLLQLATSCPEAAEKILEQKKTLAGALDAIKAEAKKHAVGGCGCVFEVAKGYCLKHVTQVFGAGTNIDTGKIDESLGDIAVYCIIMLYMVKQHKK